MVAERRAPLPDEAYKALVASLRSMQLDASAAALERAVDEEAIQLARLRQWPRKPSTRHVRAELSEARELYAAEIAEELANSKPSALTPSQILSHRRRPTVWAIACIIREASHAAR